MPDCRAVRLRVSIHPDTDKCLDELGQLMKDNRVLPSAIIVDIYDENGDGMVDEDEMRVTQRGFRTFPNFKLRRWRLHETAAPRRRQTWPSESVSCGSRGRVAMLSFTQVLAPVEDGPAAHAPFDERLKRVFVCVISRDVAESPRLTLDALGAGAKMVTDNDEAVKEALDLLRLTSVKGRACAAKAVARNEARSSAQFVSYQV